MTAFVNILNNWAQGNRTHHLVSWPEQRVNGSWTVYCKYNGAVVGTGTKANKGDAKEDAARQALTRLGVAA